MYGGREAIYSTALHCTALQLALLGPAQEKSMVSRGAGNVAEERMARPPRFT